MSRSYDIDHDAAQAVAKFRAIMALTTGTFDDPFLLSVGALPTDYRDAVRHILHHANLPDPQEVDQLLEEGFIVGLRDDAYGGTNPGRFMVMEGAGEEHSEDEWCVVGDDLAALVSEAWNLWADTYGWND